MNFHLYISILLVLLQFIFLCGVNNSAVFILFIFLIYKLFFTYFSCDFSVGK